MALKMHGVHVQMLSPASMSEYFSLIPPNRAIGGMTAGHALLALIRSGDTSVVDFSNCTFKIDMMLCAPTTGVCVVSNASKAIFQGCKFEIVTHASFMMLPPQTVAAICAGPKISIAYGGPSTSVSLDTECTGVEEGMIASGGCRVWRDLRG